MRKVYNRLLLASVASAWLGYAPAPAMAQETVETGAEADISADNSIIVTARRRGEALQDVPQTINAVTSETIQKLRLNNAADLTQVVPGIGIEGGTSTAGAFGSSSSIRGVPTFQVSNANPVVQFYLNDAPTGVGLGATQALFDIGQVEVLKGPQGTLRGRSAPTGAITITTRRPDLSEAGGYASLSGTDRGNVNFQGGVGVPLITDVLAVRIAGSLDHNRANAVTSASIPIDPFTRTEAVRGSILFQPNEDLTISLVGQKLWSKTRTFTQVVGLGNGLNGPAIDGDDRLAITDRPNNGKIEQSMIIGQIDWTIGASKLSYVGSYRKGSQVSISPQDVANVVRGGEYFQTATNSDKGHSHELRLSSQERIFGMFDYVVGGFYSRRPSVSDVNAPARLLSGSFGAPGTAPRAGDPVRRYLLQTAINLDAVESERSVFGNITAHLGEKTELSVGGRYIDFKRHDAFTIDLLPAFNAIANPTRGLLPCAALGALSPALAGAVASPVYPGACDITIPGASLQDLDRRARYKPFVYNVSLSHKFTPDFMVYGNIGTAFRSAGPRIGLTSLLSCCTQAGGRDLGSIEDLVFQNDERSTTYEAGFKASLLDRRVRLNVAVFKQDFDNFFYYTQPVQFLSVTDAANPGTSTISSAEFTTGADATVKGIDVEANVKITSRWDVNLGFTWSKANLKNAVVPCNDSNFDGTPDNGVATVQGFINAGRLVARCESNGSISRSARWNLTVQSEYVAPISDRLEGFVRGSFNYYPDNPYASDAVVIDKYGLLNMFLGVRGDDGSWEVSAFANNLLNTKQITSFNAVAPVSAASANSFFPQPASGYNQVGYTPQREFGLLVRYAFGAR
ncbi:iron complex outermembrane receptor protein [Novosphingobium chloroacetimidivorans]|uniref:Iron complex outermembrane receptor protein n=1 Tax=Novosphingobium chloroacetimidivorans TaxID=1428314 RepID=A0A7W7K9V1_9SPHN|nr:TonB-dependent receptor [Novosphingobium chloroacetimidivorans]MBB4858887.1 iron complex outermembrane receptor protein [Novosphingobium chloroacetimidivorans]